MARRPEPNTSNRNDTHKQFSKAYVISVLIPPRHVSLDLILVAHPYASAFQLKSFVATMKFYPLEALATARRMLR